VAITYNLSPIADFEADPLAGEAPLEVRMSNLSSFYAGFTEADSFTWRVIDPDEFIAYTTDVLTEVVHTFSNIGSEDSLYTVRMVALDYETLCTDTAEQNILVHPQPESIHDLSSKIKIYPNPTDGIVTIVTDIYVPEMHTEIFNITGERVDIRIDERSDHMIRLNLTHLAKGVYFLKMNFDNTILLRKLIVK
jgi:PKD repeat protein